jgi:hypothetical protein
MGLWWNGLGLLGLLGPRGSRLFTPDLKRPWRGLAAAAGLLRPALARGRPKERRLPPGRPSAEDSEASEPTGVVCAAAARHGATTARKIHWR